jgi:hypothetical protein
MRRDADVISRAYEALPPEWLRDVLVVQYRCPHKGEKCLLLHAWRSDEGKTYFYIPPYKLSRQRNAERTDPGARRRNTLDGSRVWKPWSGELAEWGPSIGLDLQCDHLDPVVVSACPTSG